jgi:AcrR family transcriptional regulator
VSYIRKSQSKKYPYQELTNKAGYNRSTFYQYFKDIYELLDYLEVFVMNRLQESLKESINSDYTDFEFIDQIMRIHDEHYHYISALIGKYGNIHFASRLKDIAIPFILEAHKISKDNVAARFVMEFHFSGILATIAYWYDTQKELPLDELKGLLQGICFEGSLRQFLKYK